MCGNKHGKRYLLKQLKAVGHTTYPYYTNYPAIFIGLMHAYFPKSPKAPLGPETLLKLQHTTHVECFITTETSASNTLI